LKQETEVAYTAHGAEQGAARGSFPSQIALIITILMWGCSFVAAKAALREVSPITLTFTRFGIGTLLLFGILVARKINPLPPRDAWPALALMGFVGIFVHQILQAFGLNMSSAVHAGWLIGLVPIWSAVLSAALLKERFGAMKIVGLVGGFVGALLVISKGQLTANALQLPSTCGDFLILVSTLNWAIYSIMGHATIKRLGATRATAGAMLFGWLMLLPFFLFERGWREWPHVTPAGWGSMIFLGLGCSGLGYLTWYSALERIEVSRVAAFLYAQPLVTLIAAVVLLNEQVTATTIIGGVIVLASVFIIQRAK
jgi:drug/metabolite transporter (DMT)-like permease